MKGQDFSYVLEELGEVLLKHQQLVVIQELFADPARESINFTFYASDRSRWQVQLTRDLVLTVSKVQPAEERKTWKRHNLSISIPACDEAGH